MTLHTITHLLTQRRPLVFVACAEFATDNVFVVALLHC